MIDKYKVADDAKPQLKLLLIATLISIGIWALSWFFAPASYIVYPIQLFATFIHEGSHVIATLATGGSVTSLTVSPDTSGAVWSQPSGWLSSLIISSAGYLGTTAFGIGLLIWFRLGYSARVALFISSGFVALMTFVFGVVMPAWNLFNTNVTFGSVAFTVVSGTILSVALYAIGKYAADKWVNFSIAFLAVQCLLNAVFSLKTLFFLTASSDAHSDAANMAAATGIPAFAWVLIWIGISVLMISVGLRFYAINNKKEVNSTLDM